MRLRSRLLGLLALILVELILSQSLACGSFHVAGAIQPSNVTVTTGTVSVVRLTVISNPNGTLVDVTAVTLLVPLGSNSLTLCGDQRPNFTVNTAVEVSSTSGQGCSNLVKVVTR